MTQKNVVHLDRNSVRGVLDRLNRQVDQIDEICVFYVTRDKSPGVINRKVLTSGLDDPLAWYGLVLGLAHDRFLHNSGTLLEDLVEDEEE